MPVRLNLVQLNIERDRHLDAVTNFLATEKPDVACLQEVLQSNIPILEKALGATCFYTPISRRVVRGFRETEGVGIFSRLPIKRSGAEYYSRLGLPDEDFDITSSETRSKTRSSPLSWCEIEKGNIMFKIAATHFTWTPDGQPDDFQRQDMKALLRILEMHDEFVLCGDFNAPRGGEIFGLLAERFTDNIPAEYTSSIDGTLHRKGALELMVDGIFSTETHNISNVKQVCGLSDHCAFTALVERV